MRGHRAERQLCGKRRFDRCWPELGRGAGNDLILIARSNLGLRQLTSGALVARTAHCPPFTRPVPAFSRNSRNIPGEPTPARLGALRVCRNSSCSYGAPCATRQAMPMLEVAALRLFPGLPRNLRVLVGREPDKHRPDQVETCSSQRPSSTLTCRPRCSEPVIETTEAATQRKRHDREPIQR